MKHCRKYADFAHLFGDAEYVSERVTAILCRATRTERGCLVLPSYGGGYARVYFGGTSWQAHRLLWIIAHGDIGGLVVDHKCRNRACVDLGHLEAVTNQENIRRAKMAAHQGKCRRGHDLTQGVGQLHCATCKKARFRDRYRSDPQFAEAMREKRRRNYARANAA